MLLLTYLYQYRRSPTNTNKNELIYSRSLILTTGHTILCPYTLSSKTSSSHLGFLTLHLVGYVSSRLNKIQYFLSLLLKTSANGKYLYRHDRYFNRRLYLVLSINLIHIYKRMTKKQIIFTAKCYVKTFKFHFVITASNFKWKGSLVLFYFTFCVPTWERMYNE